MSRAGRHKDQSQSFYHLLETELKRNLPNDPPFRKTLHNLFSGESPVPFTAKKASTGSRGGHADPNPLEYIQAESNLN